MASAIRYEICRLPLIKLMQIRQTCQALCSVDQRASRFGNYQHDGV